MIGGQEGEGEGDNMGTCRAWGHAGHGHMEQKGCEGKEGPWSWRVTAQPCSVKDPKKDGQAGVEWSGGAMGGGALIAP